VRVSGLDAKERFTHFELAAEVVRLAVLALPSSRFDVDEGTLFSSGDSAAPVARLLVGLHGIRGAATAPKFALDNRPIRDQGAQLVEQLLGYRQRTLLAGEGTE
jgi:hypothetical protein